MPTRLVRQRKLNVKSNLHIIREAEIADQDAHDGADRSGFQDSLTSLPKVESGVESKEEREHHLQAVISASQAAVIGGKPSQISIPTPDAIASDIKYDQIYPKVFHTPATYIRFSSTVEDSIGAPYCMSEEDEPVLKSINEQIHPRECSEDHFEQLMSFFEETSIFLQPFAAVDNTPVLTLEKMQSMFDADVGGGFELPFEPREFAPNVYEYWKSKRLENGNKSIMARLKTLKMDAGQEADESDPYVCFRRREARQVRKTRGRDAQITEKLKKLRFEMEEARQLLSMVKKREVFRRDDLKLAREIFEQRGNVREMKQSLGIHEAEDELLITQKVPKKRPETQQVPQMRTGGGKTMAPMGMIASADSDIYHFAHAVNKRDELLTGRLNQMVQQHEAYNTNYIDQTLGVLMGVVKPEDIFVSPNERDKSESFVSIKFQQSTQLPTPPASVVAESPNDDCPISPRLEGEKSITWADLEDEIPNERRPQYRRRQGRGGRIFMDRHNFRSYPKEAYPHDARMEKLQDRYGFDHDDGDLDDDDEEMEYDHPDHFTKRAAFQQSFLPPGHRRVGSSSGSGSGSNTQSASAASRGSSAYLLPSQASQ